MTYAASAALAALFLAVAPLLMCRLLDCCLSVVHAFMVARQVGERPVVRWDDEVAS